MDARLWGRVVGGGVVVVIMAAGVMARQQAWKNWEAPSIVPATRTAESTPALATPTMIPVSAVTSDYFDDVEGIAVELNGDARFYSFQVLNWHEIVLDTVGGTPLAITYSTLCGSSAVYAPPGPLALSGYMQETCSILELPDGTRYLQPTGEKISGPHSLEALQRIPSTVMRFSDWYTANPNGLVLSLQTGYERVYSRHPLGSYETSDRIIGLVSREDALIPKKDLIWDVLTLAGERANVGIARSLLSIDVVQNATGEWGSLVAFLDNRTATARIFNSTVDDQLLTFVRAERPGQFTDEQTQSTWNADGVATAGSLKGTQLEQLPANRLFGFAYVALFPKAFMPGYQAAQEKAAATPPAPEEPAGETITVE